MDLQGRRRRGTDGSAAAGEFLGLPDGESAAVRPNQSDESETAGGEQSAAIVETGAGVEAAVNPFWSEKMQNEAQLQAMRPQGLAEAERTTSAADSGSTELRVDQAAGTERPNRTGDDGDGLPATSVSGDNGGGATGTASGSMDQGQPSPSERLGMRSGERLVVERMKELLEDLFEQNRLLVDSQRVLQDRLDRVENDAMHSATSGGDREIPDVDVPATRDGVRELVGDRWVPRESDYLGRFVPNHERGSLDYQAGVEEGIRRATEALRASGGLRPDRPPSPPPPPPPRDEPPTTPNGTRVPSGTPPRTPTPVFGSPKLAWEERVNQAVRGVETRDRNPLARSAEWADAVNQGAVVGDFLGSMGLGLGNLTGPSGVVRSSGLFGTSESALEFASAQGTRLPSVDLFASSIRGC